MKYLTIIGITALALAGSIFLIDRGSGGQESRMLAQPVQTFHDALVNGDKAPEMVVIPAGAFMMGSPASEEGLHQDENPQHWVEIDYSFAAGKYEVTWDEWEACVASAGCDAFGSEGENSDEGWGKGDRPVINVSWDDAQDYARWLSSETGETYRLLSEAEWEYAARAGTTSAYWWGEGASHEYANYGRDKCCGGRSSGRDRWKETTAPVGSFPANAFGMHDMNGNISEWVSDWYKTRYTDVPVDGTPYTNCPSCSIRSYRSGFWDDDPQRLRSANRHASVPDGRYKFLGFRVARDLPSQ